MIQNEYTLPNIPLQHNDIWLPEAVVFTFHTPFANYERYLYIDNELDWFWTLKKNNLIHWV